jgi:hypothetical protein
MKVFYVLTIQQWLPYVVAGYKVCGCNKVLVDSSLIVENFTSLNIQ